jgi:hypothetical protein
MLPNDQQFDQLFRDLLRDHASPVRADLWRRIENGIGRRGRRVPWWPLLTVIPVACLIIFIFNPHIPHNPSVPTHQNAATHLSTANRPTTGQPPVVVKPAATPAVALNAPTAPTLAANSPTNPAVAPNAPSTSAHLNHYSIISTPEKRSSAHPDQTTSIPAEPDRATRSRPNITLPSLAPLSTRGSVPGCPLTPSSRFKPSLDRGTGPEFYLSAIGSVNFPVLYYHNSYTTGIRLTVQITPHWSATTGLQYSWATFGKDIDSLTFYYPKTFRNLAIPILIGYTFPSDYHSFAVNAGVVLNLYSSTNFNYDFPGQTGPCTYLDFIYTRNLNDRWSLFAEPYSTYFLNENITDPLFHRWAFNLHLGLRYHL